MKNLHESSPSWHRYRSLLAQEFGVRIERQPVETWRTVRGHEIHIDDWPAEGPPKGTLILVHGGGGHGRVLAPLADFAAGLGWRVLAPDLPGYGLSRPASTFRWEYAEWPAVVAELADASDGPVVLMGLSLGGMTAVLAARSAARVAGVVVTTLLDMSDPAVFEQAARWRWLGRASRWGFRRMPALVDRLSLPLWLAAPMRKMSGNAAMRNHFATDPLLGRLRVPSRFFRTLHALEPGRIVLRCPLPAAAGAPRRRLLDPDRDEPTRLRPHREPGQAPARAEQRHPSAARAARAGRTAGRNSALPRRGAGVSHRARRHREPSAFEPSQHADRRDIGQVRALRAVLQPGSTAFASRIPSAPIACHEPPRHRPPPA